MKFIDEIEIRVRAGAGGHGCVSFHREKYQPRGGPDGGDGGRGGDVVLRANTGLETLGRLRKAKLYAAPRGEPGRGNKMSGADAQPLHIELPVGTQIVDVETGDVIGDMTRPDSNLTVARGGKGGLGNQHFATSVNQSPEYAQPGMPGEEFSLRLNLKLLADAGLVGLPNAGKSTLLTRLSRSHAEIGAYPFTTITPNLGVLENKEFRRVLIADIPGIIEGASRGAGLGLSFLRHIERVGVLIYVLDVGSMDVVHDFMLLREELKTYSEELLKRPMLIALNKMDLADYDEDIVADTAAQLKSALPENHVPEIFPISANEKNGLDELQAGLFRHFPETTFAERMAGRER